MNNFTPELIAQVKAAKSAEELMALAKENNVELSEDEAKTYYEQLHTNGAVSDDELEMVAGGGCGILEAFFSRRNSSVANNCPHCGNTSDKSVVEGGMTNLLYESKDNSDGIDKIEYL